MIGRIAIFINLVSSFSNDDLIPGGQSSDPFDPHTLQLAHSIDGSNWIILSDSVADTTQHTVSAVQKIGGYYVIVGSYGQKEKKEDEFKLRRKKERFQRKTNHHRLLMKINKKLHQCSKILSEHCKD